MSVTTDATPPSAWQLASPVFWAVVVPTGSWSAGLWATNTWGQAGGVVLMAWPLATVAGACLGGARFIELVAPRVRSFALAWILTTFLVLGAFGVQVFLATQMGSLRVSPPAATTP